MSSLPPRKKLSLNNPPANINGLASQSTQQPRPVCTWSAHTQSGPSPDSALPFPRSGHTLTATATSAPLGELFLFGGYVNGCASSDLYVFSPRDFSTILLQTSGVSGEVPVPRAAHGAALIGTTFLICGGKTDSGDQYVLNHDSVYLLNLVLRKWTRIVVNGPGPGGRYYHTTTVVGSKFFVFGGQIDRKFLDDIWALDLNSLTSQPRWESYEPTPGNEKPPSRTCHVSVTTEDRIIIFGGYGKQHHYNDTWSFDISTRKWTELQCTGSIPSHRASHAAVLVDDVMYVFGGVSKDGGYLDDLYALQLSTQRWFKLHNEGTSPHGRSAHAMASDGTRVFVLGGYSKGARSDEISLIHVFDTRDIKYPGPEGNAVKTTQLARKSSTGPVTQEQPQHPKLSSLITHGRNTGVNKKLTHLKEDNVSEGPAEYRAKPGAPHSSSEGDLTRLELERQLSVSLAARAEQDQRIARLTDELAQKRTLLEKAEANAAEGKRHARLEQGRLLTLLKQRDVELVDMQAKLGELVASRDQQVEQYETELTNVRAKLDAKESELETVRSRFADAEKDLTESKEAYALHAQTATGSVNRNEDQVTRGLMERVRALEVEVSSKKWTRNEKSIEEMECRNEG